MLPFGTQVDLRAHIMADQAAFRIIQYPANGNDWGIGAAVILGKLVNQVTRIVSVLAVIPGIIYCRGFVLVFSFCADGMDKLVTESGVEQHVKIPGLVIGQAGLLERTILPVQQVAVAGRIYKGLPVVVGYRQGVAIGVCQLRIRIKTDLPPPGLSSVLIWLFSCVSVWVN